MKWLKKLSKIFIILGIVGSFFGAAALAVAYYYINPTLPDIEELRHVQLQVPLKVYSRDHKLIAEFGEKRRSPVTFEQLPKHLVNAIVSSEDANFFSHPGVDIRGLIRAVVKLAITGKRKQGGSTITMQVARNFYLSKKKTYLRKLNEIFLALRIEEELSKQEILELYLNKIYLGHRSYGVGAAARVYYGKTLDELTLAQTAMIAGLPKAPSAYNPLVNPARAETRRNYVLNRMLELNAISTEEHQTAVAEKVSAKRYSPDIATEAPYVAEMVRAEMVKRFGQSAYTSGYKVITTIDSKAQKAANQGLRRALISYSTRHGYRGAEAHVELPSSIPAWDLALSEHSKVGNLIPALVIQTKEKTAFVYTNSGETLTIDWNGLSWAKPYIDNNHQGLAPTKAADVVKTGDIIRLVQMKNKAGELHWRLAQIPKVSGALISLRSNDGGIHALIGGYDYYHSKFNRTTQAKRQPGSGFKAFIYSAALENGFTAASLINDAPVVFNDASLEAEWRPENYSGKFFGPTRIRHALTKSRNLVSIRLLRSLGIKKALSHISKFGFDPKKLPRNLSLALGSANLTPLQMAKGYAVLSNGGYLIEPYFIDRIEQGHSDVIFQSTPKTVCTHCLATETEEHLAPRVISKENRYIMYSMMQDVIQRGTATKAKVLGRQDIAGKTGTTNDQRDAWFNGFNKNLVANVWIGFDNNQKLGRGEFGGTAALPAWVDYMRVALKGMPDESPLLPENMVTVLIDPKTGLRASASLSNAIYEVFRTENIPEASQASDLSVTDGNGAVINSSGEELF